MIYSIDNNPTCSSLVEAYYLVDIISWVKVVLWSLGFSFSAAVFRYFYTTAVAHLAWYTELEESLSCEILMDINQWAYPRKFTRNLFISVSTNHFLVPQMYTRINSHKHNIIPLYWIHLVHTCSIWKFCILIVWSLIQISANCWDHKKMVFYN